MRFPGFEGEWEEYINENLFSISKEKNKSLEYHTVLSASQTEGMVERDSLGIDIKYEAESVSGYKVVRPGEYVIHLRSFQGGFAFSDTTGICSPAYTILHPKEVLSYGFLREYFMSRKFIDSLRLVTYGIRDGKSISIEEWMKLKTYIPKSLKEQERIKEFLGLIDKRLTIQNKVIERYESLIKALVDKWVLELLKGTTTRFEQLYERAGEGGTPSTSERAYYEGGEIPFVKIDDLSSMYLTENKDYITSAGLAKSSAWIIPKHSVIYSNGATIGSISINTYPVATKQGILGIVPKNKIKTEYLYYMMRSSYFSREVQRIITEGTMKTAYLKDINRIICPQPSLEEQSRMVSGLLTLSEKTSIEKKSLLLYINLKRILLSLLFI